MSLRTVRPLTSSRAASSAPLHVVRDCSSPSKSQQSTGGFIHLLWILPKSGKKLS